MIWNQIQKAKREKTDLHIIWLDPENADCSVPHQLISYAMKFFRTPSSINIVASYFNNLDMCFSLQDLVGITMGCLFNPVCGSL